MPLWEPPGAQGGGVDELQRLAGLHAGIMAAHEVWRRGNIGSSGTRIPKWALPGMWWLLAEVVNTAAPERAAGPLPLGELVIEASLVLAGAPLRARYMRQADKLLQAVATGFIPRVEASPGGGHRGIVLRLRGMLGVPAAGAAFAPARVVFPDVPQLDLERAGHDDGEAEDDGRG